MGMAKGQTAAALMPMNQVGGGAQKGWRDGVPSVHYAAHTRPCSAAHARKAEAVHAHGTLLGSCSSHVSGRIFCAGSDSDDSSRRASGAKAAARAAVAASLDNFTEEFLSWATATGRPKWVTLSGWLGCGVTRAL